MTAGKETTQIVVTEREATTSSSRASTVDCNVASQDPASVNPARASDLSLTAEQPYSIVPFTTPSHGRNERRLVRRLDVFLLAVVALMCCFNTIDRSLLSIAKIQGIEEELSMTPHQFNTAVAVFQVSYLALQLPSNLLITRVRPQLYLSTCCFAWSVVAACHARITSYRQLLILRVLLGICDAPFFVGALHHLSSWYTRRELAKRTSILFGSIILVMTFTFPMSAGIVSTLAGTYDISGWRWLYLVFGCTGMAVALLSLCVLPNYPGSQRYWLTTPQAALAKHRIVADRVMEQNTSGRILEVLYAAMTDTRTWLFVLMFFARKIFEGLFAYMPTFLATSALQIAPASTLSEANLGLLLGAPPALLAAVLSFILAWSSDRFSERTFHTVVPLVFGLAGLLVSLTSGDAVARYVSIYFYLAGSIIGSGMTWAWVANVVQETPEKKAAAIALISEISGLGAIAGPYLFRGSDAPLYRLAFGALTVFTVVDICCCLSMRVVLQRQNAKLRRDGEIGQYTL